MKQTSLSKLYQQWQPWLSWFDVQLQPVFAQLLLQLEALLRPIATDRSLNPYHAIGLSAIQKRGHYAHLLLSEWLIAEALPDEFIRRAAMNEHLFLAPEPEQRKGSRTIIALFDAGILQLGGARIVHLVMMLLLNQRAQKHHCRFYWGVIQQPAQLYALEDVESLQNFLAKRHIHAVNEQSVKHWADDIAKHSQLDECWFIGAPLAKEIVNQPYVFSHYVYIAPAIGEHHQLHVRVVHKEQQRTVLLTLPNEAMCIKILSGKLADRHYYVDCVKTAIVAIDVNVLPMISMSGNQFVTLNYEHTHTFLCRLANALSTRTKCRLDFHRFKGELLRFDFQGKKLSGLLKKDKQYYFWRPQEPPFKLSIFTEHQLLDDAIGQSFIWLYTYHASCVYLINQYNELFYYDIGRFQEDEVCKGTKIDEQVLGLFKLDYHHHIYVKLEAGKLWLKSPQLPHINHCVGQMEQAQTQIYLADERGWLSRFGICVIGLNQKWLVFRPNTSSHSEMTNMPSWVNTPTHWHVLGVHYQSDEGKIQFVMMHQDRKRIALFDMASQAIEEVYHTTFNIVQAHFSSLAKALVLTTEQGEIILYSFLSNVARVRITEEPK